MYEPETETKDRVPGISGTLGVTILRKYTITGLSNRILSVK